jgi:CheY-like chemotaxis protein
VELVRAHRQELRLVLLDLTMPELGGDEALADLRAMGFRAPVVRWSGYARTEAPDAPGTAFLQKPFRAEELMATVQGLLKSAG